MITGSVTLEDYISAHRLHHNKRAWFYAVVALLLLAGLFLHSTSLHNISLILIFAGVGGLIGHWWDQHFGFPAKVERLYKQYDGIADPIALSWDQDSIEGKTDAGQSRQQWQAFVDFRENEQVMLLYVTDQLWQVYPKRWFSAEQLQEFRHHASRAKRKQHP